MKSDKTYLILEQYLAYLITITGHSQNAILEYRMDLLQFFRYLAAQRGMSVSLGRASAGKQMRHYMTFIPPEGMKESRADKEAALSTLQFEEKLRHGSGLINLASVIG